jgi:hypothetical protein
LPPPLPEAPLRRTWYGWQTLAVDGVAFSLIAGGLADSPKPGTSCASNDTACTRPDSKTLIEAGAAIFVLGPPLVHLAHKNPYGVLGLGLRVALPVAGGLLAPPTRCPEDAYGMEHCESGVVEGVLVGALVATLIDAVLISWTPGPPDTAPNTTALRLGPMPGRGRSGLSLAGAF